MYLIKQYMCRLKTMELMSREGWSPSIDLWEEPGTTFVNIHKVDFQTATGETDSQGERQSETCFSMYYTDYVGVDHILASNVQGLHCSPPIKVHSHSQTSIDVSPLHSAVLNLRIWMIAFYNANWHWRIQALRSFTVWLHFCSHELCCSRIFTHTKLWWFLTMQTAWRCVLSRLWCRGYWHTMQ